MQITKRVEIDAGHRLLNHDGKCRHPHGHRYAFEVTAEGHPAGGCAVVLDFGEIKRELADFLDAWDHAFLAQTGDPIVPMIELLGGKLVVLDRPPSIETLVALVFDEMVPRLERQGVRVVRVRGYETPTSWAEQTG